MAAQVWEMGGDGRQGSGLAVGGLGRRQGECGLQAAITGLSAGRTHGQALTPGGKVQKLTFQAG